MAVTDAATPLRHGGFRVHRGHGVLSRGAQVRQLPHQGARKVLQGGSVWGQPARPNLETTLFSAHLELCVECVVPGTLCRRCSPVSFAQAGVVEEGYSCARPAVPLHRAVVFSGLCSRGGDIEGSRQAPRVHDVTDPVEVHDVGRMLVLRINARILAAWCRDG